MQRERERERGRGERERIKNHTLISEVLEGQT
jgi:hypothetical protein